MRLALAQMEPLWENKRGNFEASLKFLQEAKEKNADFLVFPEMSMTGYSMHPERIGEDRENSETLQFFQEQAQKFQMYIGVGYVEYREPKSYNSFAIISPQGEILADYQKIHPFFGTEEAHYQAGEHVVTCQVEEFTVAPFICYDLRFPEIFQMASETAQVIVVPVNWPESRREHYMTLLKARAIENQCYMAGVNRVGRARTNVYSGDSMIVDPYGTVIAEAGDGENVICAELDLELVETYRKDFPLKKDRRKELYVLK